MCVRGSVWRCVHPAAVPTEAVPTVARLPGSYRQPGMGAGKQTQVLCKGIHTLNPRDVSAAQTSPILFAPKAMGQQSGPVSVGCFSYP